MHQRAALGSRLHKAEDGTWFAYALWPSKWAWEQSQALPSVDPEGSRQMLEAEAEAFEPVVLTPVADFLMRGAVHSSI